MYCYLCSLLVCWGVASCWKHGIDLLLLVFPTCMLRNWIMLKTWHRCIFNHHILLIIWTNVHIICVMIWWVILEVYSSTFQDFNLSRLNVWIWILNLILENKIWPATHLHHHLCSYWLQFPSHNPDGTCVLMIVSVTLLKFFYIFRINLYIYN